MIMSSLELKHAGDPNEVWQDLVLHAGHSAGGSGSETQLDHSHTADCFCGCEQS